MKCILCSSELLEPILTDYFWCQCCDLRFLAPTNRLSYDEETTRYHFHKNDPNDLEYQNFVRPLFLEICKLAHAGDTGLDFGSGKGSALAKLLEDANFEITRYDPAFFQNPDALKKKYNFVYTCEVVEHLFEPGAVFKALKSLLIPNGFLAVMTHLYNDQINFKDWYYRKDPTHVSFYSRKSFEWIASELNFKAPTFVGERIVLL